MNEQRTQAYINLINQLLSCNEGNEPQILQDNLELLDQGLIERMVAVAQQSREAGRENEDNHSLLKNGLILRSYIFKLNFPHDFSSC